jgi:glycosyltransferase involved in cell wall biosynthesis
MRIALLADAYPPLRSSGAVQLRDLSQEFVRQGHEVTMMVPSHELATAWAIETLEGVQVLRLAALRTKDTGYVRRTLGEMLLSLLMLRGLRQSPLRRERWDAVIWYSPTIFLGPLAASLKRASRCRAYLILRDIFPEWAVDMGVLNKGIVYRFFKGVERYQYSVADIIGVQSRAGLPYLADWSKKPGRTLEVLQNWLAAAEKGDCPVSIASSRLAGRKIIVYAGNMGVAQGMDVVLELAYRLLDRQDIGFLLVGRGSDVSRLRALARERQLSNVLFHDEVEPSEVPGLLAQCHVGLVVLDPRHKTHNVPGKFLTYMQAGLPVLARINAGNDLADLIKRENVGAAYVGDSLDMLQKLAVELCDMDQGREAMSINAKRLSDSLYSARAAVSQIVSAVSVKH